MTILETALELRFEHNCSVIPLQPKSKKAAIKWVEFQTRKAEIQEITEWFTRWPDGNLAVVTGTISNRDIIDVDSQEGRKNIKANLPQGFHTPTVMTPGGGWHLHVQHSEGLRNATGFLPGCDFRAEGGYAIVPPSRGENGKSYRWMKDAGLILPPLTLPPILLTTLSSSLNNILIGKAGDFKRLQLTSTDFKKIAEGRRDEILFHIANAILNQSISQEELFQLLGLLSLHCCEPPFPLNEIPVKIQSVLNRIEKRQRNLSQEVRDWVVTSSGFFLTSDCFNGLQVTSRLAKKACVLALLRMAEEGLIERHGDRKGAYRLIDDKADDIDFLEAETKTVDLWLPFDLEEMVELMPGNIVVIAGDPNSGKTAFLLNVIQRNMDRFKMHYFSSEMGATELKKRLSLFTYPELKGWKFRAKERSSNFEDVIAPGEGNVNIIDYLEIHDNFYEVGGRLFDIHRKLEGAIAFVALQKNTGARLGLGGGRGLEKPRLYLAMEPGVLKIVKAKNWKTNDNPNGKQIQWKLAQGWCFHKVGDWCREEE